jgi:hypothetical protein
MPRLRNHLTRSVNAARYIRVGVGFWARTTSFVCEATHTTTLCLHLRTPCVMIGADLLGGGRGLGFSRWAAQRLRSLVRHVRSRAEGLLALYRLPTGRMGPNPR